MELKITIDTEDIVGDNYGSNFDELLSDSLKQAIFEDAQGRLATNKFKEFSELTAVGLINEIKLKLTNFLDEEIVLNDQWGKPTFIGSIEDLLKLKIDNVMLRPVNSSGKTIEGCHTDGQQTWIEWKIEQLMTDRLAVHLKAAQRQIEQTIDRSVKKRFSDYTDDTIKNKVGDAFSAIITE